MGSSWHNAEAAGRLGEIARRAGMDDRGRPTPAGSDEEAFPQAPSSPNSRAASFQSGNPLSSSHASDGLNSGQKNGPSVDVACLTVPIDSASLVTTPPYGQKTETA